jgi:hypothetical protein
VGQVNNLSRAQQAQRPTVEDYRNHSRGQGQQETRIVLDIPVGAADEPELGRNSAVLEADRSN